MLFEFRELAQQYLLTDNVSHILFEHCSTDILLQRVNKGKEIVMRIYFCDPKKLKVKIEN